MVSLRRKKAMREEAQRVRDAALKAARVGRTGQVARSTVETAEGDVPVVDALTGGAEAVEATEGLLEDVDALDYGLGLDDVDQYQDAEDAAHEEQYRAVEIEAEMGEDIASAIHAVDEAQAAADQAVEDAANALTTSNGKNARRRGVTEPEPPPGGWVQGDQWVRDVIVEGVPKPTEVLVWDGTEFVPETLLTGEVLVVGPDGLVRIADGQVTAQALAADAIDGKVITGAVIRTAESGQRLQLDTQGLRAFNASGNQVAQLSADTGGAEFQLPGGGRVNIDRTGSASARLLVQSAGGVPSLRLAALDNGDSEIMATASGPSGNNDIGYIRFKVASIWSGSGFFEFDRPIRQAGDTDGWIDLPYVSGWGPAGAGTQLRARRIAGMIEVDGTASGGTFTSGVDTHVATIPEWGRPSNTKILPASGAGGRFGQCRIRPNGEISFTHSSVVNSSAPTWLGLATMYGGE